MFPSILRWKKKWKHKKYHLLWICVWGELWQESHNIIVITASLKSFVFNFFFSVHTKTLAIAFKFLHFKERFWKVPFYDGLVRKPAFSNFSIVVWTVEAWGFRFSSQIEVKFIGSLTRRSLERERYWDCITKAAPPFCLIFLFDYLYAYVAGIRRRLFQVKTTTCFKINIL